MYRPILASLVFILSEDKKNVLLVHRNKRNGDQHFGKYNGLGGKMEKDEDILSCAIREVQEEAVVTISDVELRGTVSWPGFGKKGEDWFGFIFLAHSFQGEPKMSNEEGDLYWKPIAELGNLPMWEGDKFFLPLVFDENRSPFHGSMPYKNGRPVSWTCSRG